MVESGFNKSWQMTICFPEMLEDNFFILIFISLSSKGEHWLLVTTL